MRQVAMIDMDDDQVVFEDGSVIEITSYYDCFGDECEATDEVVSLVAGPDEEGFWHTFDMSYFVPATFH